MSDNIVETPFHELRPQDIALMLRDAENAEKQAPSYGHGVGTMLGDLACHVRALAKAQEHYRIKVKALLVVLAGVSVHTHLTDEQITKGLEAAEAEIRAQLARGKSLG